MTPDDKPTPDEYDAWLKKYGDRPVSLDVLDATLGLLTAALRDARLRIETLEGRLAVQEQKSAERGVRWAGVWHDGVVVAEGSLVTDRGSLWLARRTSEARPGDSPRDFTLVVKRGEVGR